MWLLLKYYLHGFTEVEEKSLYSSQKNLSLCAVMVWGLCLCPPKTERIPGCSVWLTLLDIKKSTKEILNVTI